MVDEAPVDPEYRHTSRSAWARPIQQAYEIDPMPRHHCGATMRIMGRIEDSSVMEQIL